MAYSNLDGFSVEGPAPARIAPKHVMKGGVYTISLGLFTARDTHAIASMCLQRGLRRRLAVEDSMESVFSYEHGPAERLTAPGSRVGFAERDAS